MSFVAVMYYMTKNRMMKHFKAFGKYEMPINTKSLSLFSLRNTAIYLTLKNVPLKNHNA